MKIFFFIAFVFFSLLGFSQQAFVNNVTPIQFDSLIKKNDGLLIDVRTINEFNNGHIEGALQMNFYAPDFAQQLMQLPKDKPIYIYCNVGFRSGRAAAFLTQNGYQHVFNLQQGILVWHRQNFPISVSSDAKPNLTDRFSPDEFKQLINNEPLVFIDFYAPWCAPCRRMMPMIDSLLTEYKGKVEIVKINTDASRELLGELNINAIPYFMMFVNGNAVFEHNGMISRNEIEALFKSHLSQ